MQYNDWKSAIPADFSDDSRAWIYQSSRAFVAQEAKEIDEQLYQFYAQWQTHGTPVKGWAKLIFNQFIIVLADETGTNVSGCSTDGMVRVIKSMERQYDVRMFDRLMLTFLVKDKAQMLPLDQVQYALDNNFITPATLLFNNVAATKKELLDSWLIPLKDSWLATRVSLPATEK